jgi:hypothetical protein
MSIVNGLGESPVVGNEPKEQGPDGELVSWVMTRVRPWREERNNAYQAVWGEYYRMWRGRHIDTDKSRASERSKLVSPALAQALEMTVAELEEATFGREAWVDIIDDAGDPDHGDIDNMRRQFLEDMDTDKVPDAVAGSYLNGGLWGTLAAKVVVESQATKVIVQQTLTDEKTGEQKQVQRVEDQSRIAVKVVPIPVDQLIPDPDGTHVEDMLGIAHECNKPTAWLLMQPWGRKYAASAPSSRSNQELPDLPRKDKEDGARVDPKNVLVTEYHGKVPLRLLTKLAEKDLVPKEDDLLATARIDADADKTSENEILDGEIMVEAIVTIFDQATLGRAIKNPFMMEDRSIVAAPFERVPGRFWGRGVMEKGYNPQKALDAELRTRMDVMALAANPQMGIDKTKLPNGFDMTIRPGKIWPVIDAPKDSLFPIAFPNLDPASFSQSSEMERMVQIGTGAMDTATPLSGNRRNETATGTSLIAGTFVKRAKRALRSITSNFTQPLVQKIMWRRMQYDADRYPGDLQFRVAGTLGIVARELEQAQLTSVLQLAEPKSATQGVMIKAIFDNSSSPYKAEMIAAIEQDRQPSEQEQKLQQMEMQSATLQLANQQLENATMQLKLRDIEADIVVKMVKAQATIAEIGLKDAGAAQKAQVEFVRLQVELEEVRQFARQNDTARLKVMLDASRGGSNNGGSTTEGGS